MRLLDAKALIYDNVAQLKEYPDAKSAPDYAILSHTWETEEVLFEDIALGPQYEVPDEIEDDLLIQSADDDYTIQSADDGYESEVQSSASSFSSAVSTDSSRTHVKLGWNKVLNTCLLAVRDGFRYVWIDTCCIDKGSSAELSEAINSMFQWYGYAARCYAYLSDCHKPSYPDWELTTEDTLSFRQVPDYEVCICGSLQAKREWPKRDHLYYLLEQCRWFKRGWTLQELIAPSQLWFFDGEWEFLVDRDRIISHIEQVTGIDGRVFWHRSDGGTFQRYRGSLSSFSIAQRMHWASSRQTTRIEDEAYSLLGIFGINMPLLYGEGRTAFRRLQEEIIKTSSDQSILAWEALNTDGGCPLARSPSYFQGPARYIISANDNRRYKEDSERYAQNGFHLTQQGLRVDLELEEYGRQHLLNSNVVVLRCVYQVPGGHSHALGLNLDIPLVGSFSRQPASDQPLLCAKQGGRLVRLPLSQARVVRPKIPLVISFQASHVRVPGPFESFVDITMQFLPLHHVVTEWSVLAVYPRFLWSGPSRILSLPDTGHATAGVAFSSAEAGAIFVVFSLVRKQSGRSKNAFQMDRGRSCHYWIVKDPRDNVKDLSHESDSMNWPATWIPPQWKMCELERLEHYLKSLCDRASTFVATDYFERRTSRQDCSKFVALPDGQILEGSLSASESPWYTSGSNGEILFNLERRERKKETEIKQDFFRLDAIEREFQEHFPRQYQGSWN